MRVHACACMRSVLLEGVPQCPRSCSDQLPAARSSSFASAQRPRSRRAASAVRPPIAAEPPAATAAAPAARLQGCDPATCLSSHLADAARRCGGALHAPQQPQRRQQGGSFAGALVLPGAEDAPLHLGAGPAARLFGLELAGLQGATAAALARLAPAQQQQAESGADEQVVRV